MAGDARAIETMADIISATASTGSVDSALRAMREAHDWTVSDLAQRAGIDAAHLESVEKGEREPTTAFVTHLSRVLASD